MGNPGDTNLGGATFHVSANFDEMMRGFKQAEQQAKTSTQGISNELDKLDKDTARQMKGVGMAMMNVGYIADDLQYGFRSIVNNIQPIGLAAGQALGMASAEAMAFSGAIGIVAVGVFQLYQHWGDLTDAMQSSWSGKPIEEFKKVREAAEHAAKAWDELKDKPTEMQAKSQAIGKAITEAPAGELEKAIIRAVRQDPNFGGIATENERKNIAFRQAQIEDVRKQFPNRPDLRMAGIAPLQKDIEATFEKMAERLGGGATVPGPEGDPARARLKALIGHHPDMFPKGALQVAEAADPEAVKRQEEFEKRIKVQKEVDKHIKDDNEKHAREREKMLEQQRRVVKEREDREKKAADLIDRLNIQGIEGAERAEHERDKLQKEAAQEQKKKIHDNMREDIWKLQDRREMLQEQREAKTKMQQLAKPFHGEYFDYAQKVQESPVEAKQLRQLKDIDTSIKEVEKAIKSKQREAARAG